MSSSPIVVGNADASSDVEQGVPPASRTSKTASLWERDRTGVHVLQYTRTVATLCVLIDAGGYFRSGVHVAKTRLRRLHTRVLNLLDGAVARTGLLREAPSG
eukprot:4724277-Prymnesium_polylepis.1